MSLEESNIMFRINRDLWMIFLISKEWRDTSNGTRNIVVREVCKQQEFRLVFASSYNIHEDIALRFGSYIWFVHHLQSSSLK